jgi:hypothetical protein
MNMSLEHLILTTPAGRFPYRLETLGYNVSDDISIPEASSFEKLTATRLVKVTAFM